MLMVWKEGLDSHWWIKFLYFFSVALGIKSGTSCILHYWVTSTALGVCFSLGTFGVFACLLTFLFACFCFLETGSPCVAQVDPTHTLKASYSPNWLGLQVCGTTSGSLNSDLDRREKYHADKSLCSGLGDVYRERQKKSFGQALLWAPHYISASECGRISVFRLAKECEQFTNERVESNGHPGLFS